ncbi:MAG: hypothetical protein RR271_07785 [Oscillospiraceae bacterium]
MNELTKNIAALIKVKTMVTFAVVLVFVILALSGKLSAEVVMSIVTMVVAFYFGTQSEKQSK